MLGKADATPMIAVKDLDRARSFYEDKLGLHTQDEMGGEVLTMKSGDTLSKIAKQVYGDAGQWKKIHEANKAKIPNPDLIHPGDELTIPA